MDDSDHRRLVVATTNKGKLAEFRRLLPSEIELLTLADLSVPRAPETGTTFEANARTKATNAADQTGLLAIADDSGLEVDALGGAPGIRSARYAGDGASDSQNIAALLTALRATPHERRTARFRCIVALAAPDGSVAMADGVCEGVITFAPAGGRGFGYDPVFLLPDGRTMAQLLPDEKNQISHRARAYRAILPSLLAAFERKTPEEDGGRSWSN